MLYYLKCAKIFYMSDNFHEGHRERLLEKFNINADLLTDHELLEAMLFMMIPRKDTNLLAHKLIRNFGSLENVFLAPKEKLCAVDGIGPSIASKIMVVGKTFERIYKSKNKRSKTLSKMDLVEKIVAEFYNVHKECSRIYLLNSRFTILHSLSYNDDEYNRVSAEPKEVLNFICAHKPKYLLIAHNHPSGSLTPSLNDDYTTANFIKLCDLLEVSVIDHLIIADGEYYSYATSGRLDEIKKAPNFYRSLATGKPY